MGCEAPFLPTLSFYDGKQTIKDVWFDMRDTLGCHTQEVRGSKVFSIGVAEILDQGHKGGLRVRLQFFYIKNKALTCFSLRKKMH